MPKKRTEPPRAKKGSTPRRLLLSLPVELDDAAREAAGREHITTAEWWRRAALERLGHRGKE